MRSLADRVRTALEWTARAIGVASLLALLWNVTRPAPPAGPEPVEGGNISEALARWTRQKPTDSIHLTLGSAPDAAQRDWLVALRRTGVGISWRAPSVPMLAIATEPLAEPRDRSRISVSAPEGSALVLSDEVGTIDSLTIGGLGATVIAPAIGATAGRSGLHRAEALARDSLVIRRLLVIGKAGWESRFAITALEEGGWQVDARLVVAPGAVVRQGLPGAIDTSRYSAVVVLDASATDGAAAITRYARSGGGVVLAGSASAASGYASLTPGRSSPRWEPTVRLAAQPASQASAGYLPIRSLGREAVVLQAGDGGVAVAAHRVGSGRVVQSGYDETWRWRMSGGEEGPEGHRAFWTGLITAAAYAPSVERAPMPLRALGEAAPLASLIAAMGPARTSAFDGGTRSSQGPGYDSLLFAIAVTAFLAEWASRRLRGAA